MTDAKATAAETEREDDVPEFKSETSEQAEQATSDESVSSVSSASSAPAQDQTLTLRRPPGMTPPPVTPDSIPSSSTGNTAARAGPACGSSGSTRGR